MLKYEILIHDMTPQIEEFIKTTENKSLSHFLYAKELYLLWDDVQYLYRGVGDNIIPDNSIFSLIDGSTKTVIYTGDLLDLEKYIGKYW